MKLILMNNDDNAFWITSPAFKFTSLLIPPSLLVNIRVLLIVFINDHTFNKIWTHLDIFLHKNFSVLHIFYWYLHLDCLFVCFLRFPFRISESVALNLEIRETYVSYFILVCFKVKNFI